jgi:solute carrier family 25 (mitochondrial carnitine/acylcarnitine transporter), member 20/29
MQRDVLIRKTFLNSVKDCYNNEGYKGFFKGMSFPICSVPLVNAVVFSIHELSKRLLGFHQENEMNIYEGVICGAIAGWANCIVVTPIELVKCRLQIQSENKAKAYYKGVFDCIKKTIRDEGIKAIYKGNYATMLREIPAYAAQFGGYYYAKQALARYVDKPVDKLNNIQLMLCGSVGGYFCWQFSYPQDVIKTLLQTQSKVIEGECIKNGVIIFKSRFYDGGFYECGKFIFKTEGFMGFWRGYLPCTLRAIIANAVLFVTYENSKSILSKFITNI